MDNCIQSIEESLSKSNDARCRPLPLQAVTLANPAGADNLNLPGHHIALAIDRLLNMYHVGAGLALPDWARHASPLPSYV